VMKEARLRVALTGVLTTRPFGDKLTAFQCWTLLYGLFVTSLLPWLF
jgi:hypothetical protein